MKSLWHERRQFKRAVFHSTVGIFHGSSFSFSIAKEISEGGMLFVADRTFEKGDALEISFVVSGREFYSAMAEVVYTFEASGQKVVGVRFKETSPRIDQMRDEIRAFVSERAGYSEP